MIIDSNPSDQIIASALRKFINLKNGDKYFSEYEIKGFLKELGFNTPNGVFIKKGRSDLPSSLRYPLVAKISSPSVSSKSDVQGVILDIKDEAELIMAVEKLSAIEACEGILIEEMAPKGIELIVGGIIDNQFGSVVMFGMGGTYVELYNDIAFALAPADEKTALWLIRQVRGYKLLKGYRNNPPSDINTLVRIIKIVSKMIASNLLVEIDLNPIVLYPTGALVLDAKIYI